MKKVATALFAGINSIYWKLFLARQRKSQSPVLCFGKYIPHIKGHVHGGAVKLQRLRNYFRVGIRNANIIYAVSSSCPFGVNNFIKIAKKRKCKIVWNQNGVSYPVSMPKQWKSINNIFIDCIHKADYVIYQSGFCKLSADTFLGKFQGPYSIIYNCVDTNHFNPKRKQASGPLTLLLGGNQAKKYRVEVALHTLAGICKTIDDCKLIITGFFRWERKSSSRCEVEVRELSKKLGIADKIELTGIYSQQTAPGIFNRADILLHTHWNDACPGIVIEAMSCGLPVVYSESGGVPELVGEGCGYGVASEGDWEHFSPPSAEGFINGVLKVSSVLSAYSENARKRAVELFSIELFIEKHAEIFNRLINE